MGVDVVYFDAGGGHRASAEALQLVMGEAVGRQVRLLNLQVVLDPIDPLRKLAGVRLQEGYNSMLRREWTWSAPYLLPLLHAVIRFCHSRQVQLLEAYWQESRPDLVVSVVPHFNRALAESLGRVATSTPFVTILTDLADYPPHFWIERQQQFFICGTTRAVEQARAIGIRADRIFQTSGMIVHPRFYQPWSLDVSRERQRLGMHPSLPTGLVLFGGLGSKVMVEIAKRLDRSSLDLQLILICGRNESLAGKLRQSSGRLRRLVLGYTSEVPYYMRLADFFIGKPGPGSLSEALVMNLPVIVQRSAATLPQERYNTEWVVEKQVGIVLRSFRDIARAVEQLLRPANLLRYRANAAALENRAVFEIPPILRGIVEGAFGAESPSYSGPTRRW